MPTRVPVEFSCDAPGCVRCFTEFVHVKYVQSAYDDLYEIGRRIAPEGWTVQMRCTTHHLPGGVTSTGAHAVGMLCPDHREVR